ncbi:hypothetical protein [Pandoraea sp. B-6]|uniref:hypothetical protein n=1 Tax=Pandoraea sp. B-6 TaxID=1204340 RepID=UPI0003451EFB|nr:hypothetical protein [Pandoraea sp. B-6]
MQPNWGKGLAPLGERECGVGQKIAFLTSSVIPIVAVSNVDEIDAEDENPN